MLTRPDDDGQMRRCRLSSFGKAEAVFCGPTPAERALTYAALSTASIHAADEHAPCQT